MKSALEIRKQVAPDASAASRALAKGIEIVDLLSAADSPLPLRDIAKALRLGRSSTLRLLQTLVLSGVTEKSAAGDYIAIRRLSAMHETTWIDELIAAADEEMKRLNTELAETVSLAALFDDHVRVVHTLEGTRNIRMSNYLHRILAPHASSLAKAIAAHQNPERLALLLQAYGIYPATDKTLTEPVLIFEEMARIRERGYSLEFEETVVGGCCFGAPIRVKGQPVRAAISVSMPSVRLTEKLEATLPEMVMEAARRIARKIDGAA